MTRSAVSICNMALAHVASQELLTSLTDAGRAAALCNLFYAELRDELLEIFPWAWATASVPLVELPEAIEGFDVTYAYPADCLRPIRLAAKDTPRDQAGDAFEIRALGSGEVIACQTPKAHLDYVMRIEDPTRFSALFTEALAWKIAARLGLALLRDEQITAMATQQYQLAMIAAQEADASNSRVQLQEGAGWHAL